MGLLDYHQLPNLDLMEIFVFHLTFATWALSGPGLGLNYFFYNLIFLLVLILCIKETQSEVPLILAIKINIISMFFDFVILVLCMLFRSEGHIFVWTGGLLHLLFRFISVSLLSKMCSDKTGGLNDGLPPALTPIFGVDPDSGLREPYENIDNLPHQSYPKTEPVINTSQSYSFTSNMPTYQA